MPHTNYKQIIDKNIKSMYPRKKINGEVNKEKLYQEYRKQFPLDEIDFSEDYDKIFDWLYLKLNNK